MKLSRRDFAALLAAAGINAQTPAKAPSPAVKSDDVILRAMRDEMARLRQLRLASKDPPYYVEYALDDMEGFSCSATFGGLLGDRRLRLRIPRIAVRVGSPEFDNTNFIYSDLYFGTRYDPEQFPLDDDYQVLRQALWLATDRAYKGAIEAIGRKRAALRNVTQADVLPDFSTASPTEERGDLTRQRVDEAAWKARIVALSAIFNGYPEIQESSIDLDIVQSRSYFLNSEGTATATLDPLAYVRVRASAQSADGMRLRDHGIVQTLEANRLPADAELKRLVTGVADNLKTLVAAPIGESYTGPVLFEGIAGAQLLAELLGSALAATRKPVGQPGQTLPFTPGAFEGRIGSRVLPESFTVVDDPTQAEWRGHALLGNYRIDAEGVVPAPVTVIENGVLKSLLSTRQPTKDTKVSNGRARIPGIFGAKLAGISNLFVQCAKPTPEKELRSQLLKIAADRSKPHAIVVRKMDFPSTASVNELRRITSGQERPVSLPLMAYRVYPDGREELIRGMRFRGLSARNLKDLIAAGDDLQAFDFLGNGAPFSLVGGTNYVYTSTVIAPSLLFEDVELERMDQDLPKPPVVPPPPLTMK